MRAATSGSGVATSTSTTGRPRSSSRTAPPTTYASTPATAVRMRLSTESAPRRAARVGDDRGRQLVVDRARMPGVLFDEEPVADERDRRPLVFVPELDREGIHGNSPEPPPARGADNDLGTAERAPEAVAVADGHETDASRLLGDEPAPVPGARTGAQRLRLGDSAPPRERRLEPVLGRIPAERGEAVKRHPAAHRVEAGFRKGQGRRAVGDVLDGSRE